MKNNTHKQTINYRNLRKESASAVYSDDADNDDDNNKKKKKKEQELWLRCICMFEEQAKNERERGRNKKQE